MAYYLLVSRQEDDKISIFQMDAATGRLDLQNEMAVAGGPAAMAVDPQRRFLYVGCRSIREISSYRIDQSSGGLSYAGTAPLEGEPVFLATDRKGKFVLSAYYYQAKVAVHPIGEDGVATAPPVEWLTTDSGAHAIQTDPSNRFVFVPHIANRGPNAIFQFRFDETSGHLTPSSPPKVSPEDYLGPRHFCFHPRLDILYFSDEQGCSVTAYRLDTSNGTLTSFQTVSTLPDDYRETNSCSQIQITPSGKFLYAPNRGHNSIASFAVDEVSGRLTATGRVSTEPVPRAFSLDPQGRFVFAAGLESGRLASYRVNADTGVLEELENFTVGNKPMWVLGIELPG